MKASSDKRKGATHLEQLVLRNPKIGDDTPLTLELLAQHTKVEFDDLKFIYDKTASKPYPLAPAVSHVEKLIEKFDIKEPTPPAKTGNIKVDTDEEILKFIENAPKKGADIVLPGKKDDVKFQVKGFSTKKKTMLDGIEIAPIKKSKCPLSLAFNKMLIENPPTDDLPVHKPKLVRQVGVYKQPETREFEEAALIKVYEFVNRLQRFNLGQIKTQPPPKKISSKYIDTK